MTLTVNAPPADEAAPPPPPAFDFSPALAVKCKRASKDPKKQERQARALDRKRKMQVIVKRRDVASGRWPAAPLIDRLAVELDVKGRSGGVKGQPGSERTRVTVKVDILEAWSNEIEEIKLAGKDDTVMADGDGMVLARDEEI